MIPVTETNEPRYVRCYDNCGESFDRYTVVFTRKRIDVYRVFIYLCMSTYPTHPQGFGQSGESEYPIDKPTYSHLGKKIKFSDLPTDCRKLVESWYRDIWSAK